MVAPTQIKQIRLYAPSIDKTVEDFILKPSQAHAAVLKGISKVLGNTSQAWPYNLQHEPIEDFTTVAPGKTLLIATCYFERPLAEESKEVLSPQPGAAGIAWSALAVDKKRAYIATLDQDVIYLTLSFTEVQERHASGDEASIESCLATIEESWQLPIEAILGFQGLIMPHGDMETWETGLLPTLSVLCEATIGQGMVVSGLLIDQVERNTCSVLRTADVVVVLEQLFRKATGLHLQLKR
ncbi:hypothetical protein ACEQ8H_003539 [Pleosporales sp. CAS-2024a]